MSIFIWKIKKRNSETEVRWKNTLVSYLSFLISWCMWYTQFQHNNQNIFLIDMCNEPMKPFSELVHKGIKKYLREGKRIAIIVNKKGYASGTICRECGHIPRCDHCDVAVASHQDVHGKYFGICHICKTQYNIDARCPQCWWIDTKMYGIGTQQVKNLLSTNYGVDALIIESSKVNSQPKIARIQTELTQHQVILGTSLLSTPLVRIDIDLWIVMHADLGLNIPDFQAQRNNFTFLYDIFTKQTSKNFLVQSYQPDHPSIQYACNLDLAGMKKRELKYRKENNYPPFTQMCVLLYKHEKEKNLYTMSNKLYQELLFLKQSYDMEDLEIYATPPLIYKKFGKFRYNIILKWSQLRNFMDIAYSKLKMRSRWFKVDWEPQGII